MSLRKDWAFIPPKPSKHPQEPIAQEPQRSYSVEIHQNKTQGKLCRSQFTPDLVLERLQFVQI